MAVLSVLQIGSSMGSEDIWDMVQKRIHEHELNITSKPSQNPEHNWTETFTLLRNDEKVGEIKHFPTMVKSQIGGQSTFAPSASIGDSVIHGLTLPRNFTFYSNSTRDQFIEPFKGFIALDPRNSVLSGNGEKI